VGAELPLPHQHLCLLIHVFILAHVEVSAAEPLAVLAAQAVVDPVVQEAVAAQAVGLAAQVVAPPITDRWASPHKFRDYTLISEMNY